ncbi:MAG TPA: serine/threonine-protein kinase, partial [Gemmatimonadaceae bacterium]
MDEVTGAALDRDFLEFQDAVAGQYSLERELGRGGMGIVYLAREVALDRLVAIKVLPPMLAARGELRERFLREARTAARLSHPHIVPIFRVGEAGPYVYFAMMYVAGETLTERVRRKGPLPAAEGARILREVAWALAYAHAQGVVHRDVKPDNILIEAGSGRSLVTDFGIAQVAASPAITGEGRVIGTAHYMSPEQAAGESLDGRSDLYALGIVGFFALSGSLPFDAPSAHALMAKQLTQPAPPLAELVPAVPRQLGAAIDQCLAKDPAARPASGEALAELLTVATPARREVPAPLRVWLTRGEAIKPLYAMWSGVFAIDIVTKVAAMKAPDPWVVGFMLAPWVFHLLVRATETRRVLDAGYTLDDLRQVIRLDLEQRREERVVANQWTPPILGRIIRWAAYGLFGVSVAAIGTAALLGTAKVAWLPISLRLVSNIALGFGIVFGVAGMVVPGRRLSPESLFARLKRKFWESGMARRWVEGIGPAGMDHVRTLPAPAAIPRPTELALGGAVDDLFAALPEPVQRQVRELPALARRLEDDAQGMRRRVEELDAALAEAGRDAGGA